MTAREEDKDLSYDEARKKAEEVIGAMNNATEISMRMARVVGAYYMELIAQGVPQETAERMSQSYAIYILDKK